MGALKLTDEMLFDTTYSFEARAVLAATLGHQGKNPALNYTAEAIGLKRDAVIAAQRELEHQVSVWTDSDDGQDFAHVGTYQSVSFDRPKGAFERGDSKRFLRTTRLDQVAPWARLYLDGQPTHWTELPAGIAARLPKRRQNNSIVRLVALALAREQLRRGAIQIEDDALGWLLGATERQVRTVRELLLADDLLHFERREPPCDIYTMPGATPGRETNADELRPEWTRRLTEATIGPFTFQLYACPSELETIARQLDRLGPDWALYALRVGIYTSLADRLDGRQVAGILSTATRTQVDSPGDTSPSKQVDRPGDTSPTPGGQEYYLEPSTSKTSSLLGPTTGPPQTPGDDVSGRAGEARAEKGGQPMARRREWTNDTGLAIFCFADEPTFLKIEELRLDLQRRYGPAEAFGLLRDACIDHKGRGLTILRHLQDRLHRGAEDTGKLDVNIYQDADNLYGDDTLPGESDADYARRIYGADD